MQILNVSLSVPVTIPEDKVLIDKVELERLKEAEENEDIWWTMKDLEKRINRRHVWIKEKILYPSKFREVLDVENGGFVYYPQTQGESWVFEATKMKEFLKENFSEIYSNY